jgi:curved DNA-binding protein CbpA
VRPSATTEEIHAAYRARARRLHPDGGGQGDAAAMSAVNEAWYVLRDARRRSVYDGLLRSLASPSTGRAATDEHDPPALEPDDDDLVDVAPIGARRSLLPLPWMLMLGALLVIFVFTAYAGSRGGGSDTNGVDGVLQPGSCVNLDGAFAHEVSCRGTYAGVVESLSPLGGSCDAPLVAFADPRGSTKVCVRVL